MEVGVLGAAGLSGGFPSLAWVAGEQHARLPPNLCLWGLSCARGTEDRCWNEVYTGSKAQQ